MSDLSISQQLAAFAHRTTFERLPPEVVNSVQHRVLDTLGICLAARSFGLGDGVADMVAEHGGRPDASLVGAPERYPAPQAALVNGTLAHSLDFDDTHLPSVLHPSASIVPAVLAAAEARGASGPEAIAAIAVGLEVTVRVGMGGYLADQGNMFFNRGWHATSICGTLGAAVAGGMLLGLDTDGVADALAIAASMGSGVIEANRSGGTVKRLHCGWAAHAGLTAALLARHGYTGPAPILEGRFGFFRAFLDGVYAAAAITDGLGERWEVPGIFFKPYPANHYTHAGIDAALSLRRQYGPFATDQIDRLELGAASAPLVTIGEPRDEKVRPRSGYHAQFSGPFTVATALLGGGGLGVSFEDFTDDRARDPGVLALAAKVDTFVDAECDLVFPREFPAVLRIRLRDGTQHEARVMHNRGGPHWPLTEAELRQKFRLNAERWVSPSVAERIQDGVANLTAADEVRSLMALTTEQRVG